MSRDRRVSNFVVFEDEPGEVLLESLDLTRATIVVDANDHEGVMIAAKILAEDVGKVTRSQKLDIEIIAVTEDLPVPRTTRDITAAIIVGCIETNACLQYLESIGQMNFSPIRGKWECFATEIVENPLFGCDQALVIAGSNKRGAIYGVYALSEQIGVSPWHWWADVPPQYHSKIYALPHATISSEPSVRYRGICINDKAPACTSWVHEKFGGYNVCFYRMVFELLLRLKANFLWPAMRPGRSESDPGTSFFADYPENQKTAHAWGIVVSTPHGEPMQRLSNEWLAENPLGTWDWLTNKEKITAFFAEGIKRAKGYESYFTMGIREDDTEMLVDNSAVVAEEVIETQRALIKNVHGIEDAVPQLLALHKEIQIQYDSGRLEVPDDVTLLFLDDHFGTLRRLPCDLEVNRSGGAGIFYHLEYVEAPRSYNWINSNSIKRILHQLRAAYCHGARQIWVFNVGDIKPLEVPLTFAMTLAWDIDSIKESQHDSILNFLITLAFQELGWQFAFDVGRAWEKYHQLVSLCRPEHIEPTTFSQLHYSEAEYIESEWLKLSDLALSVYNRAQDDLKPAAFQLVLHPIASAASLVRLQINLGRNQLHALQSRNSANYYHNLVVKLFNSDFELSEWYHALLGGKWNHITSQPHVGFDNTRCIPSRDIISGLCRVQVRQILDPTESQLGFAVEGHAGVSPGLVDEDNDVTRSSLGDLAPGLTLGIMTRYGPQTRWFDLFARGSSPVHWTIEVPYKWLELSKLNGVQQPHETGHRIHIQIDWEQVDASFNEEVAICIQSEGDNIEQIYLPITGREAPPGITGYVEADGLICIPADVDFEELTNAVNTLAPIGSSAAESSVAEIRRINFNVFLFSDTFRPASRARLLLYFRMTLNIDPFNPMTYDIGFDRKYVIRHHLLDHDSEEEDPDHPSPQGWVTAVQNCRWIKEHDLRSFGLCPGEHEFHVRLNHTNMVLERIVFDFGGLKESYLGPLPTAHCKVTDDGVDLIGF